MIQSSEEPIINKCRSSKDIGSVCCLRLGCKFGRISTNDTTDLRNLGGSCRDAIATAGTSPAPSAEAVIESLGRLLIMGASESTHRSLHVERRGATQQRDAKYGQGESLPHDVSSPSRDKSKRHATSHDGSTRALLDLTELLRYAMSTIRHSCRWSDMSIASRNLPTELSMKVKPWSSVSRDNEPHHPSFGRTAW
jgi:hypothetical protein